MSQIEFEEYKLKTVALEPDLAHLALALGLEDARQEIAQLEAQTEAPGFWDDPQGTHKVLQRIKQLRTRCDSCDALRREYDDLITLCELAIEENDAALLPEVGETYERFAAGLGAARLQTLLSGEYDQNNAIMSFHAGAGGTEAQDWAQMLYRMYTRWAERHGCKYTILDYLDGDEAGIKSAAILIEGPNTYGYLKGESGVHRLVRISPFDASGRRHTSFAAVEVMPEITDDDEIAIRDEDIRAEAHRSSGAGGQHVNKTDSAIRITHIPTGIVVSCQTERSQHQNREYAMRMLRSRLAEIKEREHLERIEDIKGEQKAIEWGSQIRSYVFMPYTMVKDHRTDYESGNINAVMDGEFDQFINSYLTASSTGTLQSK